jgi:hypothetical protein
VHTIMLQPTSFACSAPTINPASGFGMVEITISRRSASASDMCETGFHLSPNLCHAELIPHMNTEDMPVGYQSQTYKHQGSSHGTSPTYSYCVVNHLLPISFKNQFGFSLRFTNQPPRVILVFVRTEFANSPPRMKPCRLNLSPIS